MIAIGLDQRLRPMSPFRMMRTTTMNARMIVDTPWLPPLRVNKNPCKVEDLHPCRLAVVPTYFSQLLSQPNLGFFHPEKVRCLLRCLSSFLSHLGSGFGHLQVSFQVQDQLLPCGKLYLSEMELLTLIFSLDLGTLQPNLSTLSHPLLNSQISG